MLLGMRTQRQGGGDLPSNALVWGAGNGLMWGANNFMTWG